MTPKLLADYPRQTSTWETSDGKVWPTLADAHKHQATLDFRFYLNEAFTRAGLERALTKDECTRLAEEALALGLRPPMRKHA